MHLVSDRVEKEIAKELPDIFALIVDGWTEASSHFVGVMASYPGKHEGYETALLGFSPIGDQTGQSASDMYEYISFVLSQYGKTMNNVVAIIAALGFCHGNSEEEKMRAAVR